MIVWVLLLAFGVFLYDGLGLLKSAKGLEKGVYFALTGIGLLLLVLHSFEITVPSPSYGVINALEALLHLEK